MANRYTTKQRQSTQRQTTRQKQREREQAQRKRLLVIGGVVLVAVIAVVALILLNPKPQTAQAVGDFTKVTKQTWPQANGKAIGPADAKVVVTEFSDFQCPYCKQFHDTVFQNLVKDYVATGKARFEYHHFIVIDQNVGGTESRRAAQASECAADQNQFWDYFNLLFTNQQTEGSGTFRDERLKAFAASLGLDTAQFNACFDSNRDANKVVTDEAMARSLGLNSTPSILINNQKVQNPLNYAEIQAAIDAALK